MLDLQHFRDAFIAVAKPPGGNSIPNSFEAFGWDDWKQAGGGRWRSPNGRVLTDPVYQRLKARAGRTSPAPSRSPKPAPSQRKPSRQAASPRAGRPAPVALTAEGMWPEVATVLRKELPADNPFPVVQLGKHFYLLPEHAEQVAKLGVPPGFRREALGQHLETMRAAGFPAKLLIRDARGRKWRDRAEKLKRAARLSAEKVASVDAKFGRYAEAFGKRILRTFDSIQDWGNKTAETRNALGAFVRGLRSVGTASVAGLSIHNFLAKWYRNVSMATRFAGGAEIDRRPSFTRGLTQFLKDALGYFSADYHKNVRRWGRGPAIAVEVASFALSKALSPAGIGAMLGAAGALGGSIGGPIGSAAAAAAGYKIGQLVGSIPGAGTAWSLAAKEAGRTIATTPVRLALGQGKQDLATNDQRAAAKARLDAHRAAILALRPKKFFSVLGVGFAEDTPDMDVTPQMFAGILQAIRQRVQEQTGQACSPRMAVAALSTLLEPEPATAQQSQQPSLFAENSWEEFGWDDWRQIEGGKWRSPNGRVLSDPIYQRMKSGGTKTQTAEPPKKGWQAPPLSDEQRARNLRARKPTAADLALARSILQRPAGVEALFQKAETAHPGMIPLVRSEDSYYLPSKHEQAAAKAGVPLQFHQGDLEKHLRSLLRNGNRVAVVEDKSPAGKPTGAKPHDPIIAGVVTDPKAKPADKERLIRELEAKLKDLRRGSDVAYDVAINDKGASLKRVEAEIDAVNAELKKLRSPAEPITSPSTFHPDPPPDAKTKPLTTHGLRMLIRKKNSLRWDFAKAFEQTGWFTDAYFAMRIPDREQAKLSAMLKPESWDGRVPPIDNIIPKTWNPAKAEVAGYRARVKKDGKAAIDVLLEDAKGGKVILDDLYLRAVQSRWPNATAHLNGKPGVNSRHAVTFVQDGKPVAVIMPLSDTDWDEVVRKPAGLATAANYDPTKIRRESQAKGQWTQEQRQAQGAGRLDKSEFQRFYTKQKAALTRAINSNDPHQVKTVASQTLKSFEDSGFPYPDDWSRWQRAIDDADHVIAVGRKTLRPGGPIGETPSEAVARERREREERAKRAAVTTRKAKLELAINQGRTLSPEALAEFPDLAEKYAKRKKPMPPIPVKPTAPPPFGQYHEGPFEQFGWTPAQTSRGTVKAVGDGYQAGRVLYGKAAREALAANQGSDGTVELRTNPSRPNPRERDATTGRFKAAAKAAAAGNPQAQRQLADAATSNIAAAAAEISKLGGVNPQELTTAFTNAAGNAMPPEMSAAVGVKLGELANSPPEQAHGRLRQFASWAVRMGGRAAKSIAIGLGRLGYSLLKGTTRIVAPFAVHLGGLALGAGLVVAIAANPFAIPFLANFAIAAAAAPALFFGLRKLSKLTGKMLTNTPVGAEAMSEAVKHSHYWSFGFERAPAKGKYGFKAVGTGEHAGKVLYGKRAERVLGRSNVQQQQPAQPAQQQPAQQQPQPKPPSPAETGAIQKRTQWFKNAAAVAGQKAKDAAAEVLRLSKPLDSPDVKELDRPHLLAAAKQKAAALRMHADKLAVRAAAFAKRQPIADAALDHIRPGMEQKLGPKRSAIVDAATWVLTRLPAGMLAATAGGVSMAAGAAGGALLGGAVGGPLGMAIGTSVGGGLGGLIGKRLALTINDSLTRRGRAAVYARNAARKVLPAAAGIGTAAVTLPIIAATNPTALALGLTPDISMSPFQVAEGVHDWHMQGKSAAYKRKHSSHSEHPVPSDPDLIRDVRRALAHVAALTGRRVAVTDDQIREVLAVAESQAASIAA